ncbi:hypothetical protein WCN72_14275, partial [Staphylococcus aureus]
IAFEIVPGVTSASAAVATMQTGLTMRTVAKSVTFSTGHFKDSEENEVDIAFEIVPGVTSASAAVATMQTGLTMRTVAKSV